jgi:hypothetical protein
MSAGPSVLVAVFVGGAGVFVDVFVDDVGEPGVSVGVDEAA